MIDVSSVICLQDRPIRILPVGLELKSMELELEFGIWNLSAYPRNTLRALRSSFNMCPCIPDRIEFGSVGFEERGTPECPEKNLSEKGGNQQQTQPTYDSGAGIEPGPHWWEASCFLSTDEEAAASKRMTIYIFFVQ